MVSVKAGQGDEWANLERLENSGWLHWEHTYIPVGDRYFEKSFPCYRLYLLKDTLNVCKWAVVSTMGLMGATVKRRGDMEGQNLQ